MPLTCGEQGFKTFGTPSATIHSPLPLGESGSQARRGRSQARCIMQLDVARSSSPAASASDPPAAWRVISMGARLTMIQPALNPLRLLRRDSGRTCETRHGGR